MMTLERDRDDYREPKKRTSFGKKRKRKALQRAHRREMRALEDRESRGLGLTPKENARLELLQDMYNQ